MEEREEEEGEEGDGMSAPGNLSQTYDGGDILMVKKENVAFRIKQKQMNLGGKREAFSISMYVSWEVVPGRELSNTESRQDEEKTHSLLSKWNFSSVATLSA